MEKKQSMQSTLEVFSVIPSGVWVVAGAILTGVVALISVVLTNNGNTRRLQIQLTHERESKDRALRRERIEELFVLAERWANRLVCDKLPYMKVMRGELTYNQALDIATGQSNDDVKPERIEAIIHLYFPDLIPELQTLLEARDTASRIEVSFRNQYKSGDHDGSTFLQSMHSALNAIDKRTKALQVRIVEVARRL